MVAEKCLLYKLLRQALGCETDCSLPEGIDWSALVAFATKQGVAALAYDGLQKCYEANAGLVLPLDNEQKEVKYDWFGAVLEIEMQCEKQWKAVSALGEKFMDAGLRTLVLKGFFLGECYPVPWHRYSCDFDCFLIGNGPVYDRSAYEEGNRLMETEGVEVRRFHYKHSSFKFMETNVENHQFLTGWRGSKRWKRFEQELEEMLEKEGALRPLEGTVLLVGPPMFNALFITRHAHQHFLIEEGISLRHVCDWAMFLRRYGQELDWDAFLAECARYGMVHFAESLTRLASHVCGVVAPDSYSDTYELTYADHQMLNDILAFGDRKGKEERSNYKGGRVGMALRIIRSRWKFRLFSDESALGCALRYAWGFLFDKHPTL